ncbi:MAG: LiaF transmembrane domain-containing protein [Flavitalea sp.]
MDNQTYPRTKKKCGNSNSGKIGGIIILIGTLLLVRELGFDLPDWLFRWYSFMILVGIVISISSNFRDKGGLIVMLVGGVFLLQDVYSDLPVRNYIFPVGVIVVGIIFIISAIRRKKPEPDNSSLSYEPANGITNTIVADPIDIEKEDVLDIVTIFGAIKRLVVSKRFRGGEIVTIFAGAEINLVQADFQHSIEIEVVAIFGGTKIIVPSNWNVRSDAAVAIFGGVEDKRSPHVIPDPNKTLIIKGSTVFGGIEIVSYA